MATNGVDVYVKLPTGRTTSVSLAPSSAVREISRHVGREEGVPGDRVILKYQGKALSGHKTVGQYGIRPETILKAEVSPDFISFLFKYYKLIAVSDRALGRGEGVIHVYLQGLW